MRYKVKNTKGLVFIITLVISALMILIGVGMSNMILQNAHLVKHLKRSMQAQYLAEAGISDAIEALLRLGFSAKDTAGNFPQKSLGPGTYDVTVAQSGGRILLSSEGVVQGVSRIASAEVEDLFPDPLNYALATGSDIVIKAVQGYITIKGDLHANGDLNLKEQGPSTSITVQVQGTSTGKATSSGTYSTSGNVVIANPGDSGGSKPLLSQANFSFGSFKNTAQSEGIYYSSSQTFNNATLTGGSAGITYVDGDATFTGNNDITGGFVASGDITLNNGNSITQSHDAGNRFPMFMSDGATKLYGLFDTQEGNIVYATNSMKIQTPGGTSAVLGSVVSGGWLDAVANNNVTLTYYKVDADEVVPAGIDIVSWNR